MAVQEKLISAEQFWDLAHHPDFADKSLELVEGVLLVMSRPGAAHGLAVVRVVSPLSEHVEENDLGYVTVESGYILFENPDGRDTVRGPDVAFVAKERLPNGLPEGYIPFAPDLAVEVVSPYDLVFDVEDKVDEYLRAGTRLVWVLSSRSKTVTAYTKAGVTVYNADSVLDGGDVLPGFQLSVTAIFRR